MQSDKKKLAAAVHLREQATVLATQLEKRREKISFLRDRLAAAEQELEDGAAEVAEAERAAEEAEEAARGLTGFPDASQLGVSR